jgi:predicted small integral membrane protein
MIMTTRVSKALLLFALGFYYTLVVFNNTNDYHSNLTFVHHVLMMDTTYPGNHGMWRAIQSPTIQFAFFGSIVIWEIVTGLLCYWGGIRLLQNLGSSAAKFHDAKSVGVAALTLSLLMWLVAFLSVGNEWFLMWQSKEWSGEGGADHMFAIAGIILLYLVSHDVEAKPS